MATKRKTTAAKQKTLQDLFHETLKDIYFAEKQILKALPKMAKAANCTPLAYHLEMATLEAERLITQDGQFATSRPALN